MTSPRLEPIPDAGARCNCSRCGEPCRVADARDTQASMLRFAKKPDGYCLNCAVAEWFVLSGLRESTQPRALLLPHVQAQFAAVVKASVADSRPGDIDWSKVVEHWDLPFAMKRGKPRRLPGFDPERDAARSQTRRPRPTRKDPP